MANDALRRAGIDPTPRPDAPPGSDAAQAARFHRLVHDELSAFESSGRKPTEAEAYDIVNGLKDTAIKSGWLKVSDRPASPAVDPTSPRSTTPSTSPARSWRRPGRKTTRRRRLVRALSRSSPIRAVPCIARPTDRRAA